MTRRLAPEIRDIATPATMTVDEVAGLLDIARKTVYEAAGRGEIPHRRLGRRIIFSRAAIMEWLNERTEKGRAA